MITPKAAPNSDSPEGEELHQLMACRWSTIERAETKDGPLELRRHESGAFLIMLGGRVLMDSHANRSEVALAEIACSAMHQREEPLVLTAGLGMGCTLRAALGALPPRARVEVCEIHDVVVQWCRGPLDAVNRGALSDPRVRLHHGDVGEYIVRRAREVAAPRFDGILLDLSEGPHANTDPKTDPFYGDSALANAREALTPHGVLAVWAEAPDAAFERRLVRTGFEVEVQRPGRGGRKHATYLAKLPGPGVTKPS